MKRNILVILLVFHTRIFFSQILLQEDFQTTGSVPGGLPSGWITNTVYQTEGTGTASDDGFGPAFRVHNSSSANSGGYWPVPQWGSVNNRFAAANDDAPPCDCDNIDSWIQSPSVFLSDYEYTEVWGIVNYTPVLDTYSESQDLGDGPELLAEVYPGISNLQWDSIYVSFQVAPEALPINIDILGYWFQMSEPGYINISSLGITEYIYIYLWTENGEILSNVLFEAYGTYDTGEVLIDVTPANPGDVGAEVIALDSTFVGNYTLSFDFFHDMNFGGGDATVQISTDNGASWQIIDTLTVDVGYWQSVVLPLYAYNGNNVIIRFQWTDAGSWASGFAVDNVIVQKALNNDMIMSKTIASDWNNATFGFGYWEYSQIPVTQASPIRATSVVYNGGYNNQPGVSVNYEVSFNGNAQATFASDVLDVVSLDKDTLTGVSTWTPSAVGTVSIAATVVSPNGDDNMGNNISTAQIEITNDIYARDLGAAQAWIGPGVAYEFGNLFDIYANDQIGAIDVAVNFAAADEGSLIQGRLYEFTGLDAGTGEPMLTDLGISTIEYAVTAADNNAVGDANFIHLTFDAPVSLEAGKIYMATIISDGAIRTPVSGNNDWSVSWLNDGTWGATGGIPMIRLNFDETLAQTYGCTDPLACNFNPVATAEDNSCYFPSNETCDGVDNDCNGLVDDGLNYQYWYADYDGDGLGNYWDYYFSCVGYSGYVSIVGDCDDYNASITGSSTEICDGVDNDCDGDIDDEVSSYYYYDGDNDGFGNSWDWIYTCSPPAEYVESSDDCNDSDPMWHEFTLYYMDIDGDGFGFGQGEYLCSAPPSYAVTNNTDCFPNWLTYLDNDGDGFGSSVIDPCGVTTNADCNDFDNQINISVAETCDLLDNDCDGVVDDGLNLNVLFLDADADGFGGVSNTIVTCQMELEGYVLNASDCSDMNGLINPNAAESCDGIDNDCDGSIDDGLAMLTFFIDADADGFGSLSAIQTSCQPSIPGYTTNAEDCDDSNSGINPGAIEVNDNSSDENCDGIIGVSIGIDESSGMDYVIYPNPSQTYFSISGLSDLSIVTVFDVTGKEVMRIENYVSGQKIAVDDLSSGFYNVQIQTGDKIVPLKLEVLR